MSQPQPGQDDFQPRILLVGRQARVRVPLLQGFLKQQVSRYGIMGVAVNSVDSIAAGVLQIFEKEGISPDGIETGPLGRAVNQNLRLVVFVSETVKGEAPIIASPCEKMTLDLPDTASAIKDGADPKKSFYDLTDQIKQESIPKILDEIKSGRS